MNQRLIQLFLISIAIIYVFQSCSTSDKETITHHAAVNINLEGSWVLSKYIEDGGKDWLSYGPEIIYQKHITPTHFTWYMYNTKTDLLVGAGGGKYKFGESTYTEYIEFFHPPGSTMIGQAIPFDVNIDDGVWFHTGYSRELEFDPESGEFLIVDTTKIEEQWVRFNSDPANKGDLVGTWDLAGSTDSTFNEHPDFVGYLKLITPSHFTWIRYNSGFGGGELIGLGSGTWQISENNYLEKIDVMYPQGSNQINTVITFNMSLQDEYWHHSGYIKRIEYDTKGISKLLDSSLVDEIWIAVPEPEK